MEWIMHYQVTKADLHLHYFEEVEKKPSLVNKSTKMPGLHIGMGLFATKDRKINDELCAFPGYWMDKGMWGLVANKNGHYAFSPPETAEWACMQGLVYATHASQANLINAATIQGEVLQHTCTNTLGLLSCLPYCIVQIHSCVTGARLSQCPL